MLLRIWLWPREMAVKFPPRSAKRWMLIAQMLRAERENKWEFKMARYVMRESRATEIAELAHSVADFYFPDAWIDPQRVIQEAGVTLSFGYYKDTFDGML